MEKLEKIESGIKGMDVLLNGGFPEGRTFLVSGSCGTGKTLFASQFILEGLDNKEPCVYVTFEQGKKKLFEDLVQVGINLETYVDAGLLKVIGGAIGRIRYFKDNTKANFLDITKEIEDVVKQIGAKRVVIDSINLYLMLFESDSERRNAMVALTSRLEEIDCSTLLTCEVREGTKDISWHGFEEFVVDGVVVLYRIPFENTFERAVSVVKMRGTEHSQNVRALKIKADGITVYPNQEPFHGLQSEK